MDIWKQYLIWQVHVRHYDQPCSLYSQSLAIPSKALIGPSGAHDLQCINSPHVTAVFRSIDQTSEQTPLRYFVLPVALVQTIYTTYGNDGIHLKLGPGRCFVVCRLLGWTSETSLAQSKNIWLLLPGELLQNRVKHIPFVENHVLSSLPVFPTLGAKS